MAVEESNRVFKSRKLIYAPVQGNNDYSRHVATKPLVECVKEAVNRGLVCAHEMRTYPPHDRRGTSFNSFRCLLEHRVFGVFIEGDVDSFRLKRGDK